MMKHLNTAQAAMIVLLCVAGSSCTATKETSYITPFPMQPSGIREKTTAPEVFVFHPVFYALDSWEEFRQKADFSIRYNEIRIAELKIYLKRYSQTDDSFYQKNILTLEERNRELKKRIERLDIKSNKFFFMQRFTEDMAILVQELKDFSLYNQ